MARLFADVTPLRTPDFRRLWLAGIVTVIGGNLTVFAVPVQVYALTRSSLLAGVLLRWVDLSTLYLIDAVTCLAPIWATFRPTPMPILKIGCGSGPLAVGVRGRSRRHPLPGGQSDSADVVRRRHHRDGVRASARVVPADGSRKPPATAPTAIAAASRARWCRPAPARRSVFSGWLPRIRRQGLAVVLAIVVWGLAITGFGVAAALAGGRAGVVFWIALGFLALGGAADMVSAAFRTTILQEAASDDLRGRLQGVFIVVVAALHAFGLALDPASAGMRRRRSRAAVIRWSTSSPPRPPTRFRANCRASKFLSRRIS